MLIVLVLLIAVFIIAIKAYGSNFNWFGPYAPWVNWIGNQICYPKEIVCPTNKEELIELVKEAYSNKIPIRAYGSGHSWSKLVCTPGYLINTDKLNRIISVNKENWQVRVEGGIKLRELNHKLKELGLALSNLPFNTVFSIAGTISTASHGTGKTGTISSFIKEIELITAFGEVKVITEKSLEELSAARVGLGSLGIIYAVTIQCEPLFKLEYTRRLTTWDAIANQYNKLVASNDYFMFFWNPYTDRVLSCELKRTHKKITSHIFSIARMREKIMTNPWLGVIPAQIAAWIPALHPYFTNILYKLLAFKNFVEYSYNVLGPAGRTNKETKYFELEIAVAQELLVPAAEKVKAVLSKHRKQQVYTFFGVLFRFTEADNNAYLSPSSGQKVVYISVLTSKHAVNSLPTNYKNLYKEIEEALLVYGGKPHWGKINFLTSEKVKKLYGDDLAKFKKIKQKFDPLSLFTNPYTKNLLEG